MLDNPENKSITSWIFVVQVCISYSRIGSMDA